MSIPALAAKSGVTITLYTSSSAATASTGNMARSNSAGSTLAAMVQGLSAKAAQAVYGRSSTDVMVRAYVEATTAALAVKNEDQFVVAGGQYDGKTFDVVGRPVDLAGLTGYVAIDGLAVV